MAKKGLYRIYDKVADTYSPVFQETNDRTAKRSYLQQLKQSPYPGDYALVRVGWVDEIVLLPDFEPDIQDCIDSEVHDDNI